MDRNRSALVWVLFALPVIFLGVFFFYPLASILRVSLAPDDLFDPAGFVALFTTSYYAETLWFTTWQAALSTVLTVSLALPGAYVFTRFRFRGRSVLMAFATLPFVLPTVVVAAAFGALVGDDGVLNTLLMRLFAYDREPIRLERTLTLVLLAHIFYNYAIVLRMVTGYWANQSRSMEEAAQVLGATGWRLWLHVRLPVLRPALTAAAVLVFIFTFTSFGVVLILGGPQYATLEVEIQRQVTSLFNLPLAAALSLVQIGAMLVLMVWYTRLQRNIPAANLQADVARRPRTRTEHALVGINLTVMTVLLFAPLGALVMRSVLLADGPSLSAYAALNTMNRGSLLSIAPLAAVWNSLRFALTATIAALVLGVLASYLLARPRLNWLFDPLFMLPLATSAVTLGFGFIIALDEPPLNLRTSPALIPIAHTLVALPFVVRSVLPALRSIPPSIGEAASVLGASPWTLLREIELPLISRGMLVGATFAFTVSMGEFGASLFVTRPQTVTMPVVIYRLLGRPGATYDQALAMSVLLMAVCAAAFVAIERLRTAGVGEF